MNTVIGVADACVVKGCVLDLLFNDLQGLLELILFSYLGFNVCSHIHYGLSRCHHIYGWGWSLNCLRRGFDFLSWKGLAERRDRGHEGFTRHVALVSRSFGRVKSRVRPCFHSCCASLWVLVLKVLLHDVASLSGSAVGWVYGGVGWSLGGIGLFYHSQHWATHHFIVHLVG
jgi:hypothetical protein